MSSQAEYDSRRAVAVRRGRVIGAEMRRSGADCPALPEPPSPDAVPVREGLEEALRAAMREGLVEGWHEEDRRQAGETPPEDLVTLRLDYAELEALRQMLAERIATLDTTRAERALAARVAALVGAESL